MDSTDDDWSLRYSEESELNVSNEDIEDEDRSKGMSLRLNARRPPVPSSSSDDDDEDADQVRPSTSKVRQARLSKSHGGLHNGRKTLLPLIHPCVFCDKR